MSYAGMAAGIVGNELQGWAAMLEKWGMQKAYQNEQARQNAYQQQALDKFKSGLQLAGSSQAPQMLADAAKARQDQYGAIGQVPLAVTSPATTKSYNPAADQAYINLLGGDRARLGAYQDWQLAQQLGAQQTARDINQIANFAGGTASVFPYELYQAQHSQDIMSQIGQSFSSLGGAASSYGNMIKPPSSGGMGGGYGQGTFSPYGGSMPGYSLMQGFQTPYGSMPTGWNTLGGGFEGTAVAG
jgi:hypothetical protein